MKMRYDTVCTRTPCSDTTSDFGSFFGDISEVLFMSNAISQINNKHVSLRSILFPLKEKSLVFASQPVKRELIRLLLLTLLLLSACWRTHRLYYFFKISCLVWGWKPSGALLSQTLITDSHNSQPVDSHQQTPLGVPYTPFLPLFTIYPSTHLLPLVLDK